MENMILIFVAAIVFGITGFVLARLNSRHDPEAIARMSTLEAQIEAAREQARQKGIQAAELEHDLEVVRDQLADAQQRATAFEERARVMGESRQVLENAFKSLSADALKNNNQQFLALARETLVSPVRESLDKVDQKILALEKARVEAYGEIRQQFTQMSEAHGQLRTETAALVKALRQPHVRGRWGEIQLKRVVEMAGMMPHCDFAEQQTVESDDGKLRPDLIVKLPGNRQIVVDAKAPITAYLEAHEATHDDVRKTKIQLHAQLMRRHLDALAKKSYWEQFPQTPEVVVMFIPGEAFYSAALEADPELLDTAFGQNVIIASPASLMALLKAASYGWRQESIAENAREISQLGQELHARLGVMADHLAKVGKSLASATSSYNDAIGSFESRVLTSARKFKELGATSQDAEIFELRAVEGGIRRLQGPGKEDN